MILKIEPVPWNYYVLRRRLILDKWLVAKNLKTKKLLDAWCIKNAIAPPEKDHFVWRIMKKINKPVRQIEEKVQDVKPHIPEVIEEVDTSEDPAKTAKKVRTKRKKQDKDLA